MSRSWVLTALVGTVLLFVALSTASLSRAVGGLERQLSVRQRQGFTDELDVIALLRKERGALAAERSLLSQQIARMSRVLDGAPSPDLAAVGDLGATEESTEEAEESEAAPSVDAPDRPVPLDIEIMDDLSWEGLNARSRSIPSPRPNGMLLLQGDIERVLADESWNPGGKKLGAVETERLRKLLREYRYFARESIVECTETLLKPLMKDFDLAEAYVEFDPADDTIEAVRRDSNGIALISVTGPSEREGLRRRYYFEPDVYPEVYHWDQVETERGLERYVEIYELLNGAESPTDDETGAVQ